MGGSHGGNGLSSGVVQVVKCTSVTSDRFSRTVATGVCALQRSIASELKYDLTQRGGYSSRRLTFPVQSHPSLPNSGISQMPTRPLWVSSEISLARINQQIIQVMGPPPLVDVDYGTADNSTWLNIGRGWNCILRLNLDTVDILL